MKLKSNFITIITNKTCSFTLENIQNAFNQRFGDIDWIVKDKIILAFMEMYKPLISSNKILNFHVIIDNSNGFQEFYLLPELC